MWVCKVVLPFWGRLSCHGGPLVLGPPAPSFFDRYFFVFVFLPDSLFFDFPFGSFFC